MASLQNRNGSYRILFAYQRKQRTFTIGRVTDAEAKTKADHVDYLRMRLAQGLIALPPGSDIVVFLRHDGVIAAVRDTPITRGELALSKGPERNLLLAAYRSGSGYNSDWRVFSSQVMSHLPTQFCGPVPAMRLRGPASRRLGASPVLERPLQEVREN
jgi:hypothetical protein